MLGIDRFRIICAKCKKARTVFLNNASAIFSALYILD